MTELTEREVVRRAKRMFKCDAVEARDYGLDGKKFLLIARKRRSEGRWFKNGKPYSFDYLEWRCIASGKTWAELWKSARLYKHLLNLERRYGRIGAWERVLGVKLNLPPIEAAQPEGGR